MFKHSGGLARIKKNTSLFAPCGYGTTTSQIDGTYFIEEIKPISYDLTYKPASNYKWNKNGNQIIE